MTSPPDKTKFHTSHSYKWERPQSSRTLSQQISVEIPLVLGINSAQFSPGWCLCKPNSILSLTSFSTVVLKTKTLQYWSDWWWLFTSFDRRPTCFQTKTFKRWSDWWWLFHIFWQKTDMLPNKNSPVLVWLMVAFHIFWQKTDMLPNKNFTTLVWLMVVFHIFWQKINMLPTKNFPTLVWLMVAFHIFWQKTNMLPTQNFPVLVWLMAAFHDFWQKINTLPNTSFDRKPTCFPTKTFQHWSDWWWLFTSFDRRLICLLSIPLSFRHLIMWYPWLCACMYWVLSSSALHIFPDTGHLGIN